MTSRSRFVLILLIIVLAGILYAKSVFNSFFDREAAAVYDPCSDRMYIVTLAPDTDPYFKNEFLNPFKSRRFHVVAEVHDVFVYGERMAEREQRFERFRQVLSDSVTAEAFIDSVVSDAFADTNLVGTTDWLVSFLMETRSGVIIPFAQGPMECDLPEPIAALFENEEWYMDEIQLIGFLYGEQRVKKPLASTVHDHAILIKGDAYRVAYRYGII